MLNKCSKKAQVALFVIITIILVIGIASYFVIKRQNQQKVDANVQEIYNHVQTCTEESLKSGLALISLSGGYIIPPEDSLITDSNSISYWYYKGNDISPTIEDIENDLNLWTEISTLSCLNFSQFPNFEIEGGDFSSETTINQEKVSAEVNYPLIIKKEDKTYKLEKPYKTEQSVRLGKIYDFAKGVVYREILDPDTIDTDYLLSQEDFNVTILPYENDLIYVVTDTSNKNRIEVDSNYIFMFANKFNATLIEAVG